MSASASLPFSLTVLGTSGSVPAHGRNCSGVFLQTPLTDVLIDCGEGTQMQLQRAGLSLGRCSTILISHLHGDHYFGLPGLLSSLSLSGRTAPLLIVSPQHLRPRLSPLFELDRFPMPYPLEFRTYSATAPEPLLSLPGLEVLSFPLQHRVPTNGYLLRETPRAGNIRSDKIAEYAIPWPAIPAIKSGGDYHTPDGQVIPHAELVSPAPPPRSFAYCSDTQYFPELASHVRGVDLLYHEASFLDDLRDEAQQRGHSTARQAATVAHDAGAGELVMGHFSSRYASLTDHEEEARTIFPNSHAGRELGQYAVPFVGREDRGKE
ncbi:ribonuclease Z [Neolewinella lacunae]|uniref:Ribonuclease Z n=1 Tax=Neolewinella lacunae TaxID=1517758 RepID=A0A923PI21_9BACT|nr:ribonuclease Z [Neolewinella lacunae]MBC6994470.1 ribonuclease Z [Neolewinella lacunae]MDN3634163.1 ribonuclease Z [Neolewinella lacunae]